MPNKWDYNEEDYPISTEPLDYEPRLEAEPQGRHVLGAIASLLGLGRWQRGERAGTPSNSPGALKEALPDLLGNLDFPMKGAAAAVPLAAGSIQWAKNLKYPQALLHRAIGGLSTSERKAIGELDEFQKIIQAGRTTQRPTSMFTPGYTHTFAPDGYNQGIGGLLFNINEPNQIRHMAPFDLYTVGETVDKIGDVFPKDKYLKAYDRVNRKFRENLGLGGRGELQKPVDRAMTYLSEVIHRPSTRPSRYHPAEIRKYEPTERASTDWFGSPKSGPLAWPDKPWNELSDPMKENLDLRRFFGAQRGTLNEVIPEIGGANLAGVRLPHASAKLTDEEWSLARALGDFGRAYDLPIFRTPVTTRGSAKQMLQDEPWTGDWILRGTKQDPYYTTSRVWE